MIKMTKRDLVERELLEIEHIKPYTPEERGTIERYKDGTFGVSNLAFALYANGHNLRGKSSEHPSGLMFEDGETLFSIGYYRKELDPECSEGYLFVVAPRGRDAPRKIVELSDQILNDDKFLCKGVYARFLKLDQYLELLTRGFLPIKESPWHPEAPEEDETYINSIVNIEDLLTIDSGGLHVNLVKYGSRNSRRKARDGYNRFSNCLRRNNIQYSLFQLTTERVEDARSVIDSHFEMLRKKGKAIGSTPEDHYNCLDPKILTIPAIDAYIGYLGEQPVSVFVGESLGNTTFGLYTPFTLRDIELVHPELRDPEGFTAMPMYSYIQLFTQLRANGIVEVHLGGSELPDLNVFKRQLGGKNDPSYWAVRLK